MENKVQLLNGLIKKYNYKSYLEIGVQNPANNYDRIEGVETKFGVDPGPGVNCTHKMTSDAFFIGSTRMFDLILVDGDHVYESVYKDLNNALKYLNEGGTIVAHDCNPLIEEHQAPKPVVAAWTGTAWKALVRFRYENPNLRICTVAMDAGCAVIRVGKNNKVLLKPSSIVDYARDLNWGYLVANRKELLNLIEPIEFDTWIDEG